MPTTTSIIAGLLPLAGAVAVTARGLTRIVSRRERTSAAPPQPKEIVPETPARRPRRRILADAECEGCGTSIPGSDRLCPLCARERAGPSASGWTTAMHWAVFLLAMAVIFGAGAILAP